MRKFSLRKSVISSEWKLTRAQQGFGENNKSRGFTFLSQRKRVYNIREERIQGIPTENKSYKVYQGLTLNLGYFKLNSTASSIYSNL